MLEALHRTRTRPACIDVLNRPASRAMAREAGSPAEAPWVIVVGFEDNGEAVGWQVRELIGEVSAVGVRGLEGGGGRDVSRSEGMR